jgi:hypothetical protein
MAARMMVFAIAVLLTSPLAAASLPDPTALPKSLSNSGAASVYEEPVLAWVRLNGRNSIAWYGGTTVKLGDAVEGGRVTAIREDHIVISGKDGRHAVYLLDQSVRTQPQARPRPARKNRN